MNETEKRIIQLIDEHREELIAMGNELYTRAERGFAEVNTSAFIADKLKKLGLNVQTGLAGTGLRASAGKEGGVNVALISELDGILCPSHPQAAPDGMSHACGHHAQMTAMLGAAIALTCPEVAAGLHFSLSPRKNFSAKISAADSGRKISPPTQAERRS